MGRSGSLTIFHHRRINFSQGVINAVELAPDGKSLVAIVSRVNYLENRFDTVLVWIDVASGWSVR